MQKYILIIFSLFITLGLSAQIDVEVLPNPATATGDPSNTDIKADAVIVNNGDMEIRLLWERRIVDMPDSWETWVCDANLCYTSAVTSCPPNRPVVIPAGDTVILQVHIDPATIAGEGTVDVDLMTLADPNTVIETGTFTFDVTTTSTREIEIEQVKVFPNPATNYFTLNPMGQVRHVEIYTIVGKRIKQFVAVTGKHYPVQDLDNGIYLVSLLDDKKQVLKTIRLSKH